MTVTALGVSPLQAANLTGGVSLWDVTGNRIAYTGVGTGAPQINQTRYNNIIPITLNVGETYYLQCVREDSGDWMGQDITQNWNGSFSVDSAIRYLGGLYGYTPGGAPQLTANEYFAGVNLQFEVVPEPSVPGLVILGLALLSLRMNSFWSERWTVGGRR